MMFRSALRPGRSALSSLVASSSSSTASSSSTLAQRRLASSLVYLEHKDGKLNDSVLNAVTAAQKVDGETAGIIVGPKSEIDSVLEQAKKIDGISKIYTAPSDATAHHLAETVAPILAKFLPEKGITHLFGAHTAVSKNIFPRVAGQLDVAMIADIVSLEASGDEFTRPIYAGNAILKVKSTPNDKVKVVTVRTTAFDKAGMTGNVSEVEEAKADSADAATHYLSEEMTISSRPDLSSAPRVVSGGRALKSKENFSSVLDPLADALNAAVGASRAAVDAGYADNSLQVGQTGKVVAPELYVAVGISGAIQHLAGMKESKMIVAINKDADAPIFQVADVGLVADLFNAVPEMAKKVEEAKK